MDWKSKPPTEKQIAFLRDLGYPGDIPETRGAASALIDEIKTRADEARCWGAFGEIDEELEHDLDMVFGADMLD